MAGINEPEGGGSHILRVEGNDAGIITDFRPTRDVAYGKVRGMDQLHVREHVPLAVDVAGFS